MRTETTVQAEKRADYIRLAESRDIARIIELGWENAGDTEYRAKMVYDENTLEMYVGAVLADAQARCLVYEHAGKVQGVFAFNVFPNFYQYGGALVATMIIWTVAKPFRGKVSIKLLGTAEMEARKLGATRLLLTGPGEQFQKLCEHCEFEYLESSYVKTFTPDRQEEERRSAGKVEILKGAAIAKLDPLSREIGNGPFYPGLGLAAVKRDETGLIVAFTAVRIVLHAAGSYVAPEYRGNGISYELRSSLEDALRAEKVSEYYSMPGSDFERELFAKYGHVDERLVQVKEL